MGLYKFFDKVEDKVRGKLSHWPLVYGFVGGIGVVLFWRGVWHIADYYSAIFFDTNPDPTIDLGRFPDGLISLIAGSILLLVTGLFVSNFIGNEIIISGLRGEKKLAEKTEAEVKTETGAIGEIREKLENISKQIEQMGKK